VRRKLESAAPGAGALIATVRGGGYMFTAAVSRSDTSKPALAKPASKG
jgi:DNA-binding winged helix-turn-helix (wHTH) protein